MTTVHLLKDQIDRILDICDFCRTPGWLRADWGKKECACRYKHQAEAMVALYKLIYPNWDQIESVNGFPQCHPKTAEYIAGKFMSVTSAGAISNSWRSTPRHPKPLLSHSPPFSTLG